MAITQSERSKFYEPKNKLRIVIGVAIALVIIWIATPLIMHFLITGKDAPAERGQFGDMFGVITSLFSCLTIVGLIYTIIQQQESYLQQQDDLQIAREALSEQKAELKLTRDEFIQQNKTLSRQRFENTFFKMLELQNLISKDFSATESKGMQTLHIKGREVIKNELNRLFTYLEKLESLQDSKDKFPKEYYRYIDERGTGFVRYLQNLETIYLFICDSIEIENNEKQLYIKLFAFQLEDPELAYLFYYLVLFKNWTSKTRPKELDLFKHLNVDYLGHISHLILYQKDIKV